MEETDYIFDLLVGDNPPDKQHVGPVVVEVLRQQPTRFAIKVREVRYDREDGGSREAERLEVLAIEFGIAEREVAALAIGLQLATTAKTLARQRTMDTDKVFRWRDVVINQRHPIRQCVGGARGFRTEREMMQDQIRGVAVIDQFAIVAGQRLEAIVSGFDEDL